MLLNGRAKKVEDGAAAIRPSWCVLFLLPDLPVWEKGEKGEGRKKTRTRSDCCLFFRLLGYRFAAPAKGGGPSPNPPLLPEFYPLLITLHCAY